MTRQVLFVQGAGENVHDEWDNELVASLEAELGSGYTVRYPRMPNEADPKFDRWSKALRTELSKLKEGAILVGHSVGATVLVHTLAADPPKTKLGGLLLLAAPFIGEGGWPSDEVVARPKLGGDLPTGVSVHIFHGDADEEVPPKHATLYGKAIPQSRVHLLKSRDHQFGNDLSEVAAAIRALAQKS